VAGGWLSLNSLVAWQQEDAFNFNSVEQVEQRNEVFIFLMGTNVFALLSMLFTSKFDSK
jgi:hypothetical protein